MEKNNPAQGWDGALGCYIVTHTWSGCEEGWGEGVEFFEVEHSSSKVETAHTFTDR